MKTNTNPDQLYEDAADKLRDAYYFLSDRLSYAIYRKEFGDLSQQRLISFLGDAKRSLDQARVFLREAQAEES